MVKFEVSFEEFIVLYQTQSLYWSLYQILTLHAAICSLFSYFCEMIKNHIRALKYEGTGV